MRCVVRVNLAGQYGQSFVCGSWGTLPLCERMREMPPSFLYSTTTEPDEGPGSGLCAASMGRAAATVATATARRTKSQKKDAARRASVRSYVIA